MVNKLKTPIGAGVMIVKANALVIKKDRYHFIAGPFTGAAIEFDENGVGIKAIEYKNGKPIGDYVSKFFPEFSNLLKLDADYFQDEEISCECSLKPKEPAIVYEFDENGYSSTEELFDGPFVKSVVWCHEYTTNLHKLKINNTPIYELYEWDDKGKINKIDIKEKPLTSGDIVFEIELAFNSQGMLHNLSLDGKCFDRIKELQQGFKCDVPDNNDIFKKIYGADRLFISGKAVNDEVLANLIKNNGFKNVKELVLFRTSISKGILNQLKRGKNCNLLI